MRAFSLLTLLFYFNITIGHGQIFIMDGETDVTSCTGFFVDSGGLTDGYEPGNDLETLICPNEFAGTHTRLDFQELDLAVGDTIRFYDGITNMAPELEIPIDIHNFEPFGIAASVTNESGCILVRFNSDASDQASGWVAGVNCQEACQRIVTEIVTSDSPDERDDVFYYCAGDVATFSANVTFPDNGLVYMHSTETTEFEWYLASTPVGGNDTDLSLSLNSPGVYDLRLEATDQFGCTNLFVNELTIIVSSAPELTIDEALNPAYCPGEIVNLFTYYGLANSLPGIGISAPAIPGNLLLRELELEDPLLLPDGTGAIALITINISNAPGDLFVTEEVQLDSIWFALEHSYSGDFEIQLTCPSGESVIILEYPSGMGSTNFGEPFTTGPVDQGSNDFTPGIPYRYNIVSEDTLTLVEFDEIAPTYTYTTVPSDEDGAVYSYADTYIPAGTYRSEESFSNFFGCPVNGEWSLRIQDNLGLDNGHLFSWGLAFTGSDQDNIESAVSWQWEENAAIINTDEEGIEVLIPETAGPTTLSFSATDAYGCSSDTVYTITHLPIDDLSCQGFSPTVPDIGLDPQPWPSPNPFGGQINLQLDAGDEAYSVRIFNASGQVFFVETLQQPTAIFTDSWPSGGLFYPGIEYEC